VPQAAVSKALPEKSVGHDHCVLLDGNGVPTLTSDVRMQIRRRSCEACARISPSPITPCSPNLWTRQRSNPGRDAIEANNRS
jgi:hypothetical protein